MKAMSKLVLGCGAAMAALSGASDAWAQQRSFDVPAGAAVKAIPEFARQAGIQIVAPAERLTDIVTPQLKGDMDTRAALLRLIDGTGLEVVSDSGDMIVLRAVAHQQSSNLEQEITTLEEVVVTATRRDARLQDVPLSISALGEAQLAAIGADGFLGFYRSVPGLTFNQGDAGRGSFVIRGVSSGDGGDNQAPVAVYIDEFPTDDARGARGLTDLGLFDVQRVEVLRGPQGTLFGSGALGGAVRVITNKPDPTAFAFGTEGDVSTIEGGGESYSLKGMVNVPLVSDKLAVRTVGYYRDDAGYVDNLATGKTDVNTADQQGGRIAAKLLATDDLALTATVVYQQSEVNESAALDALLDGRYVRSNTQLNAFEAEVTTYNLVVDYDLGIVQLMSSTTLGHKETQLWQGFESGLIEGLPLQVIGPDSSDNLAQELRLTSSGEGPLKWVGGAFYFERERDVVSQFISHGAGELLGGPSDVLMDAQIYMRDTEQALYGEVSYAFTERLEATAGLRWFENEALYRDVQQGLLLGEPMASGTLRHKESEVTPKVVLSYKPDMSRMVYASAAKGYRIGGTNIPSTDPAVPRAYTPDSLWNYELGAKTAWLDGRLGFNAAIYYIDWKDIQIERTSLETQIGYQDNGGAAHSQGIEVELSFKPATSLKLSTALSWNSARSDETVPGTNILDGDRLPDARDFTASATAEYTRPISDALAFFARGDYQYVGDAYADFDNANAPFEESYQLVNLRVGLQHGAWTAMLYADNVLNEDAIARINSSGNLAFLVRPRTIGINLRTGF